MGGYWQYRSSRGTFRIAPRDGGFAAYYENEDLGWYQSAQAALDDLAAGHTFFPSNGLDPSSCGLPEDISEWEYLIRP